VILAALALATLLGARVAGAQSTLRGSVVDRDTRAPVAQVKIILDSLIVRVSATDGSFDFGTPAVGSHVLVFEHFAYARRTIHVEWPRQDAPLVVELEPAVFTMEPIEVEGERTLPSLPVSAVSFDRDATTLTPGNIANDPLRTVQSHPSATTAGIDFLSTMAVRGGNTEEHRVYFDGFPLRHYAHVGGFSSVVYDDMLESTTLVPGAVPIRYHGSLSGIVLLAPGVPDTNSVSLRYDITSIAGGITQIAGPSVVLQAAVKSSFFNLPVYQQVGVEERSFQDLLARAVVSAGGGFTITPTLLIARDSETGTAIAGTAQNRDTQSTLAGIDLVHRSSDWETAVRPYYAYYKSHDALTWSQSTREHRLNEAHVFAEVSRQGSVFGVGVSGDVGVVRHEGHGGDMSDTPFSIATEVHVLHGDVAALVLSVGGSREEWTSSIEPEAYGSVRVNAGDHVALSAAFRRSHQTPFIFSERRYFASIPIDAGDLATRFAPTREEARAVRMDQASAEAVIDLPFRFAVEGNGFWREYDDLLRWDWSAFPTPGNVTNGGTGRGYGYEILIARDDPDGVSLMAAGSQARVWKTDGTLLSERVGDFDRPEAWQVGGSVGLSKGVRLSARWVDVAGRPFTPYVFQTTPPPTEQVNSDRLPRFQRLDVKLTFDARRETVEMTFFIDIVNLLNRRNIAMSYALEISPGEFVSVPYGGTRFFPIGGVTLRW
jgi:hypothetical protein